MVWLCVWCGWHWVCVCKVRNNCLPLRLPASLMVGVTELTELLYFGWCKSNICVWLGDQSSEYEHSYISESKFSAKRAFPMVTKCKLIVYGKHLSPRLNWCLKSAWKRVKTQAITMSVYIISICCSNKHANKMPTSQCYSVAKISNSYLTACISNLILVGWKWCKMKSWEVGELCALLLPSSGGDGKRRHLLLSELTYNMFNITTLERARRLLINNFRKMFSFFFFPSLLVRCLLEVRLRSCQEKVHPHRQKKKKKRKCRLWRAIIFSILKSDKSLSNCIKSMSMPLLGHNVKSVGLWKYPVDSKWMLCVALLG